MPEPSEIGRFDRAVRALGDAYVRFARGVVDLAVRRGAAGWVILGFVAVQLLAPLHYYAIRRDTNDERFAWRMFSPTRMQQCAPTFLVDGASVPLGRTFHEAWIEIAKRGRYAVLEAMGQRLCKDHPGSEVRLDLQCRTIDGQTERWGGADLCKFPEL